MKINRSVLVSARRWSKKTISVITISIAILVIVMVTHSLDRSSVSAQSQPTPLATTTPIATPIPTIKGKTIKVATRLVSPFVVEENGELGGFSIELWQNIARELEIRSTFQKYANVTALLDAVKSKQADLAISAISVTSQREQSFDFSQPIFDSGLQILVRSQGSQGAIGRLVNSLFTPTLFQLLGIMAVIVLIPAHIIWLVERNHKGGFLENSAYFPGIFKACWWAAATLATQAEEMPKSAWGRIMAVIWMFISVVFIAYFTATVTASLTVDQLQSNIKGPGDLPGKKGIHSRINGEIGVEG
jgi:polar amino acid transport system substrate-binding protein